MKRVLSYPFGALLLLMLGVLSSPAFAGSTLVVSGATSQPIGHYEFCQKNRAECEITLVDRGPIRLTKQMRNTIARVHVEVNRAIQPLSDYEIFGKDEVWAYPTMGVGDCEDYVLLKRQRLHAAGIPLQDLLITVVRKRDGEGHAVLTVRTTEGDYILDNLNPRVVLANKTTYKFLKRVSSTHTGRWVRLQVTDPMFVASTHRR